MKKMLGIVITVILLVTFSVPVLAEVIPDEGASSDTPEFTPAEWTEPELLPQEILDAGDLRYVGMDYTGYSGDYGDIFSPAFAMWGGVHTNQPYFSEVDMYIYTPTGTVVDFNYNLGWWDGVDETNDWIVAQVDYVAGAITIGSPYLIDADFNSGIQMWSLPTAWQYIDDAFEYEVASYDWNGTMDYAGLASFDVTRPPLSFAATDWWPDNSVFLAGVYVDDWAAYKTAGIQGMMILDFYGKAGVGQAYYWELSPYMNSFFPMIIE